MRELTAHKVNGVNDGLKIQVLDEPGHGGACHHYKIGLEETVARPTIAELEGMLDKGHPSPNVRILPDGSVTTVVGADIFFQNGPIKEAGVNGVTHEALLAVVIDRLECFQAGPYACDENAQALERIQNAMYWLKRRTEKRLLRGVEGTHQK